MMITERLDNKKVLIWGYGREGKSTEAFLKTHCKCSLLDIYEGSYEELPIDDYDIVIKSPGISHLEYNPKITSQTQLFLSQFSDRTIGVTGTKGKSTTVSLLYEVLSKCLDNPVMLVGNIGYPCFDFIDEIKEDTVIIYELSCHQLCNLTVSPHIAVFLNLFEEHLDYYHSFENYFKAKRNIALHQNESDFAFLGENVPHFPVKSRLTVVGKNETDFSLKIPGEHNQINANFVFQIASCLYGIDENEIRDAMEDFAGLSHRLEYVCTKNGVRFYDDSISTIPEAAVQAVKSVDNVQTVLIGGMDRGIDYSVLVDFIKEREDVIFIFMYETGDRIYRECKERTGTVDEKGKVPFSNCVSCRDLTEAVAKAAELTKEGKACVLSPAAPSYKYFKNFEERGEVFKSLIKGLPSGNCADAENIFMIEESMGLKVRKAVKQDENRIKELFIEMLQTIYKNEDVNGYEDGYLDKFFDNHDDWICAAETDGTVIAYLSIEVHHEQEDYIYLDDLSVSKKYRNKGIGTRLINIAERFAKETDIRKIVFHVDKSNTSAFRLYERLGYSIMKDENTRFSMVKRYP